MPQFVMPANEPMSVRFEELPEFVQGYIEALFFTSTGTADDDEGLEDVDFGELTFAALREILDDCQDFVDACHADLALACEQANYDMRLAGRDFWYTRNGHGVGFWDRGFGNIGERLSTMSRPYGESYLYRGDDGRLYVG